MDIIFVKPVTCSRCKGEGYLQRQVVDMGRCFKCGGAGVVESDKGAIASRAARVARHHEAAGVVYAAAASDMAIWVGWTRLEVEAPARFAKAIDSVLAGRADVFPALAAYAAS